MQTRTRTVRCAGWVLLCLPALPLAAAAQQERSSQINSYGAVLDNIDVLIDHYANFVARKYDLTDEQDQYTRQLLREKSHAFLDEYEDELRGIIDEMFDVRTGGEMAPEELIAWGERAGPLYEQAKKLIIDGNEDWREILSEEQRATHDADVKLMYESFRTTEEKLDRILTGQMTVEEFSNPRRSRTARSPRQTTARPRNNPADPPPPIDDAQSPDELAPPDPGRVPENVRRSGSPRRSKAINREPDAREPRATDGQTRPSRAARRAGRAAGAQEPAPPPPPDQPPPPPDRRSSSSASRSSRSSGSNYESTWDKYVKDFIAKYQLDDAQTQKANTILEDCKKQAGQYMLGRKSAIERIDSESATLKKTRTTDREEAKKRTEKLSALSKQKAEMLEPLDRIFDERLKPRLEKLPTRAQRKAAEAAAQKKSSKSRAGKKD